MYIWLRLSAGSGKSTLVKFIISALNFSQDEVAYVAYTGKAANVLNQKGCPNATTAHKLLYKAIPLPDGKYIFQPKDVLEQKELKIIIVDEISMLPKTMWNLLLSHGIYVLALGDPFQLPPLYEEEDNHVLDNPHVFLDEIMRQAQDSEIIRLSMWIREGKPLNQFPCSNSDVMILDMKDVTEGVYLWPDQILCATNQERNRINDLVRQLKGFGFEPQVGDKIISLKNHWDHCTSENNPITNGSIMTIQNIFKFEYNLPRWYKVRKALPVLNISAIIDDNPKEHSEFIADYSALKTGTKLLSDKEEYIFRKNKYLPRPPFEFNYGYAITCHKAQGS